MYIEGRPSKSAAPGIQVTREKICYLSIASFDRQPIYLPSILILIIVLDFLNQPPSYRNQLASFVRCSRWVDVSSIQMPGWV